ncbi:TPM domain-containing protein [Lysobacter enzymogenes]|uniref:TPM domain-containing protein n=1 Tax=Lysobacter enzymogenes TaxID=69 RepID=UPI001A96B9C0|nr:TPM domain-containing protein [Lysobacter enzymogenes]QQP98857.1 TPM domain-containing protein [Lysobacter enzymogenes]
MRTRGRVLRALLALGLWLAAAAAFAQPLAPIPAMDSPVVDTTGTLDATARAGLEAQARALQQRKGSQLQVLMVASTQPEEIDQYAVRAFEQFKLGRKGVDDGVLLVVAKDDRRVRIEVGYGLEGAITDAQSGRIIQEYLAPKFRNGDYAGGLIDATAALTRLIDGEPLPEPLAQGQQGASRDGGDSNWVMALVVAIVGSSLIRGIFGGMSALLRGAIGGIGAGVIAWLLAMSWGVVALAAVAGFVFSLFGRGGGHYAGGGGWGGYGGGWGGGGGGGGGGWSGGGGSSGGGGASGSW